MTTLTLSKISKPFRFRQVRQALLVTGISAISGLGLLTSAPSMAQSGGGSGTAGTAPADVVTAVNNTTATIQALGPIALAAVSVALVPFGAGMALKFVRGVMSRA